MSNCPRTAAEEELMEAQLDSYNKRHKNTPETTASDNDETDKPPRRSRQSAAAEAKAGRWVAPVILGITMIISGILWILQKWF